MASDEHLPLDSGVHRALLLRIVEEGACPPLEELAGDVGADPGAVEASLRRLEASHGVVLHPGRLEPWCVHPFSLTPTHHFVQGERRGWWAPCIWCALGVSALVGGRTRIHTRLGAESGAVAIEVEDERVEPSELVVHFATPVARAWENVHAFCAATLAFTDEEAVRGWCAHHGRELGAVVPIATVRALATQWYGGHLAPDWRKWSVDEAAQIFRSVGLTGPTWELGTTGGRF